jgi:hypothetical protein
MSVQEHRTKSGHLEDVLISFGNAVFEVDSVEMELIKQNYGPALATAKFTFERTGRWIRSYYSDGKLAELIEEPCFPLVVRKGDYFAAFNIASLVEIRPTSLVFVANVDYISDVSDFMDNNCTGVISFS